MTNKTIKGGINIKKEKTSCVLRKPINLAIPVFWELQQMKIKNRYRTQKRCDPIVNMFCDNTSATKMLKILFRMTEVSHVSSSSQVVNLQLKLLIDQAHIQTRYKQQTDPDYELIFNKYVYFIITFFMYILGEILYLLVISYISQKTILR